MDTKLTLKLNQSIIEKAKEYASSKQMSLSKIVEAYLQSLTTENITSEFQISPFVKSIATGTVLLEDLNYKKEYSDYLIDKYIMSKRIFIDTNIMLDLLGERKPFYEPIAKIATLAEKEKLTMVASPISFATVNYFLTKFESPKVAREKLRKFKLITEICSLDGPTIEKGLNSSIKDFEGALQYFNATESSCEIIITRNGKDFKESLIPVMTAEEFLKSLTIK